MSRSRGISRVRFGGLLALIALSLAILPAAADAASTWAITSSHLSATGSTTLPRGNGANAYTLTVTNGSMNVGDGVTCDPGIWTGGTGTAFQWLRNGVAIAGATSNKYTLVAVDAGTVLQCRAIATNAGGGAAAATATAVVNPVPATALSTPPTTVSAPSGTGVKNTSLTCAPGIWSAGTTFTYQWLRNGSEIAGATSSTYLIQETDVPGTFQCQVNGTNAAGTVAKVSAAKASSPAPSPVAPTGGAPLASDDQAGSVAGGVSVGKTLTCASTTTAASTGYQWLRNGAVIAGATASTYVVTGADAGTSVQCQITAINPNASTFGVGGPVAVAPAPAAAAPVPPTVAAPAGTAAKGNTLTCNPGVWPGSVALTYQWYRNGILIAGATSNTYVVQEADLPAGFQCRVTGTNANGAVIAFSGIRNSSPAPSPSPPSTGTITVMTNGDSVTATVTLPEGLLLDGSGKGAAVSECLTSRVCELAGTGWICSPIVFTCSRSDILAAGAAYPPIKMNVSVKRDAPDNVTPAFAVSGGGPVTGTTNDPTAIGADTPFKFLNFKTNVIDDGGAPYTQAGGHPYEASASFAFPTVIGADGKVAVVEDPKSVVTELPAGFLGNPAVLRQCPIGEVNSSQFIVANCPRSSATGFISLTVTESGSHATALQPTPLYSMIPEHGYPAEFGFSTLGKTFFLYPHIRTDGDFGISVISPATAQNKIKTVEVSLCGHGLEISGPQFAPVYKCAHEGDPNASAKPFLTNTSRCDGEAPTTRIHSDTWARPGRLLENGDPDLSDTRWASASFSSPQNTGCNLQSFAPTTKADLSTDEVSSPAGFDFDLQIPQTNDPTDLSMPGNNALLGTPPLQRATVRLAQGLTLSTASASGLESCSDGANPGEPDRVRVSTNFPVKCPDGSKIAEMEIVSPLIASRDLDPRNIATYGSLTGPEPLRGELYLITPHEGDLSGGPASGGLFRVVLQVNSDRYGVFVKVAGTAKTDPVTGQLTTEFPQNPQLAFSHIHLKFKGGPHAVLSTPDLCGAYSNQTEATSWSKPDEVVNIADPFQITSSGSACPADLTQRPFAPDLKAGSTNPQAGHASPFTMRLTRGDRDQEFSSIDVTAPAGLTAKLRGVPVCTDAALAAAAGKSGNAEIANPSCPVASRVGTTTVGVGNGPEPFYPSSGPGGSSGSVYLAGPYKNAPLSLAFVVPAVAGPFDLGTEVVRTAVTIDPVTAQVSAFSDPLPQMTHGIPLKIRDVRIDLDRNDFTLNPTNCEAKSIEATVHGASGATSKLSNHFQVDGCKDLAFKPKLALKLKGGTERNKYPALTATLTQPEGQSNIGSVAVTLPHSEFLAQNHINTVCTRVQFAAKACPAGSIYGFAEAQTPILDEKLEGPVYLRSSDHKLPDLVAALRGPASRPIEVDLVGRIDSVGGRIRNTFDLVPDAPVSKFTLRMKGGVKGLLVNSRNLCNSVNRVRALITGQNGMIADQFPVLQDQCSTGKARSKHRR